jgi:hypothetical protein
VSEDPNRGHSFDELARNLASGSLSRRRALKIFAAAVVGALVPSPALAVPGPCPPGSNKVTICHRPPGNEQNAQTLCVGPKAAQRHDLNHPADTVPGACPPSPPGPPPPPPCSERGDPCGGDQDCCDDLECKGEPGNKHCRRRDDDDDECRERGERCGGDRPECCGNLVCRGEPGEKRCRRRRHDDPEDPG